MYFGWLSNKCLYFQQNAIWVIVTPSCSCKNSVSDFMGCVLEIYSDNSRSTFKTFLRYITLICIFSKNIFWTFWNPIQHFLHMIFPFCVLSITCQKFASFVLIFFATFALRFVTVIRSRKCHMSAIHSFKKMFAFCLCTQK